MKISMWNIFEHLVFPNAVPMILEGERGIERVRLLTSDAGESDTVFVGIEETLAIDMPDCTFIVFRHDIVVVNGIEPSEVFNSVCEIVEMFRQWESNLSKLLTEEEGLAKMMAVSRHLLAAPAMIYDSDGHALALTDGYPASISPVWANILKYSGLTEADLQELADNIDLSKVFVDKRSTYHDTGNPRYPNFAHCSLRLKKRVVAHLVVFEFSGALQRGIDTLVDELAEKMSAYIELHADMFGERRRIQHGLSGLIEGRIGADSPEWTGCSSVLGWKNGEQCTYQVVVALEDVEQEAVLLPRFYEQLSEAQSDVAVTRDDNHISILQCLDNIRMETSSGRDESHGALQRLAGPLREDATLRSICTRFARRGFVMGASSPFGSLDDIILYHDQALAEASRCLREGIAFSSAQDNGGTYFANSLRNSPLAIAYADRQVLALHDFDCEHDTEYLITLRTYLLCGRQLSRAAKQLHIHRNSLAYRLERIEEIIGPLENVDFTGTRDSARWIQMVATFVLLE